MVRALLKAGADVENASDNGFAPIYIAAKTNQLAVVEALLDAGADTEHATDGGFGAIYVSAYEVCLSIGSSLPVGWCYLHYCIDRVSIVRPPLFLIFFG